MIDLRSVYRHAEENNKAYTIGLVLLLVSLIFGQIFLPPWVVLSGVLSLLFLIMTFLRPLWTLSFLALYLPFESFLLKFVPNEMYLFARYFSEGLIYFLAFVAIWYVFTGRRSLAPTPISLPFVLFLIILGSSAILHAVPLTIATLGMRQILRFILVFFVVLILHPPKTYVRKLTSGLFLILLFQSVLGFAQPMFGNSLDAFLLPGDAQSFGDITLTSGVDQFWDPGTRIFATFGRYDRLGTFLAFFFASVSPANITFSSCSLTKSFDHFIAFSH